MQYTVKILDERAGWAGGINGPGLVVGGIYGSVGGAPEQLFAWWTAGVYTPSAPPVGQYVVEIEAPCKVNDFGYATVTGSSDLSFDGPFTVAYDTNEINPGPFIASPGVGGPGAMTDINNLNQVLQILGQNYFLQNGVANQLNAFPQPQIEYFYQGINDIGDVVGWFGGQGVFYSSGQMNLLNGCQLVDINNNGLAVGISGLPVYVDFSLPEASWQVTQITFSVAPLAYEEYVSWMAVNNAGTIVGTAFTSIAPPASSYPFVYQVGGGPAQDLNSLVATGLPPGYSLASAMDINESGQIVGAALDSTGLLHPYIATPTQGMMIRAPWLLSPGDVEEILDGFLFLLRDDQSGRPGYHRRRFATARSAMFVLRQCWVHHKITEGQFQKALDAFNATFKDEPGSPPEWKP